MDWNEDANKVTLGVGILLAIVLIYAIYRLATRNARGSSMYRPDAQARRVGTVKTILLALLAMAVFGGIIWLIVAFGV